MFTTSYSHCASTAYQMQHSYLAIAMCIDATIRCLGHITNYPHHLMVNLIISYLASRMLPLNS